MRTPSRKHKSTPFPSRFFLKNSRPLSGQSPDRCPRPLTTLPSRRGPALLRAGTAGAATVAGFEPEQVGHACLEGDATGHHHGQRIHRADGELFRGASGGLTPHFQTCRTGRQGCGAEGLCGRSPGGVRRSGGNLLHRWPNDKQQPSTLLPVFWPLSYVFCRNYLCCRGCSEVYYCFWPSLIIISALQCPRIDSWCWMHLGRVVAGRFNGEATANDNGHSDAQLRLAIKEQQQPVQVSIELIV